MPTYISMLNWTGSPQPRPADVRVAVLREDGAVRLRGLHSIALLPDEGACSAVVIATADSEGAVERLAAAILPSATVRVESMRFDDRDARADTVRAAVRPSEPRDYLEAVLEAVVSGQRGIVC